MAREQKTKSKASQAHNARSKQRVAPAAATQVPDITSTIAGETQEADHRTTTDTTNTSDATSSAQPGQGGASSPATAQQSAASNQEVVWTGLQPSWPSWPSSKPGPRSTPPAPGMRPINKFRSEQCEGVGYNQHRGEQATPSLFPGRPATSPISSDQPTAQETLGKRKHRL